MAPDRNVRLANYLCCTHTAYVFALCLQAAWCNDDVYIYLLGTKRCGRLKIIYCTRRQAKLYLSSVASIEATQWQYKSRLTYAIS